MQSFWMPGNQIPYKILQALFRFQLRKQSTGFIFIWWRTSQGDNALGAMAKYLPSQHAALHPLYVHSTRGFHE